MNAAPHDLPFSRLFLRDLLVRCDLGYGSQLLDVGCGDGRLAVFCHSLGIDVTGVDDDAAAIAQATEACPDIEFHCGTLANSIPFAASNYDVAFVRGMTAYQSDLFSIEAFASTANLLSCLKPLGRLIFLFDDAMAELTASENSRQEMLTEHFAEFPGRCRPEQYAEGIGRFLSPSFLLGRRQRRGHKLLTMQVPPKPIDRLTWHTYAREAVVAQTTSRAA